MNITDLIDLNINKEPSVFSYSRVSTFEQCPAKYYRKYILNEARTNAETQIDLIEGKVLHEFAEKYNPDDDPEKLFGEIAKELVVSSSVRQAIFNIVNFKKQIALNATINGQEKLIQCKLTDGIEVRGVIDLLYTTIDGFIHIIDYKSAKSVNDNRFRNQLILYQWLVSQNLAVDPEKIKASIYYVRLGSQSEELSSTANQLSRFAYDFLKKIETINSCRSFVYSPGFMCRYCEYNNDCKYSSYVNK